MESINLGGSNFCGCPRRARDRAGRDESGTEDETRAEQKMRREQSRIWDESRAEEAAAIAEAEKTRGRRRDRRRAETKQSKTGRVPCTERKMRKPEFAGEARSFIGSAQHPASARGGCRHAHAAKGAHLAPLTQPWGFPPASLGGASPPNFWKIIFNGVSPPPHFGLFLIHYSHKIFNKC